MVFTLRCRVWAMCLVPSDALVMMRYAILTYLAAKNKARFYPTFDTLRDQNTKQCFGVKLLHFFLNQLRFVINKSPISLNLT